MPTRTEFDTVAMLTAMEGLTPAEQFLTQTLFPRTQFFEGRFAQVDSRKGRRLLAPVVKFGQPGRAVAREPVKTSFFEVPEIKPVRVSSVADLDQRILGENSYSRRSAEDRLAEILVKDIADLTDAIVRRIEKMASDLLLSGSISYALDDGTVESLVYGTVTPTVPTAKWDAAGDPVADLTAACNAIITASGLPPDVLIMGASVVSALLSNPKVQSQLNTLHLVSGSIQPTAPKGIGTAQYLGALYRPYLSLYSYSEAFEDDAGALKKMVPDDTAIVGCSSSPATVSFGSVSQTEQDGEVRTYADVKYVPRRLSTPREDKVELRIASRPALVPYDLSGWVVIKPLTGTLLAREGEREEHENRREKR
jgi:hypothetical protein